MENRDYRQCADCDYWIEETCCNGDSDKVGEWTDRLYGCKHWAKQKPMPAFESKADGEAVASCPRCEAVITKDLTVMHSAGAGHCPACGAEYTMPTRLWGT